MWVVEGATLRNVNPRPGAPKKLDLEGLKNYAHRTLAARPLSSAELRQKLRLKAENPADIETVMESLREYKAIDDEQFAKLYAASRKQSRGFGAGRVLQDLRQRKIQGELAGETVAALYAGADEVAMIRQYLEKKYRGKDLAVLLKEPKHVASAFRKLRAAGFSAGQAIQVLKNYTPLAEDIPED